MGYLSGLSPFPQNNVKITKKKEFATHFVQKTSESYKTMKQGQTKLLVNRF